VLAGLGFRVYGLGQGFEVQVYMLGFKVHPEYGSRGKVSAGLGFRV